MNISLLADLTIAEKVEKSSVHNVQLEYTADVKTKFEHKSSMNKEIDLGI